MIYVGLKVEKIYRQVSVMISFFFISRGQSTIQRI